MDLPSGILSILALILIIAFSLLVTKIATVALIHTGMSRENARFQARSAFTGAGFTTTESEVVTKHPIRRRIIMVLILLGNAGLVTAIASLILGFVNPSFEGERWASAGVLLLGALVLIWAAYSQWLDRHLGRLISWALKRFTSIRPRDYARLMDIRGNYTVSTIDVAKGHWCEHKQLSELNLPDEGVLVLGIQRDDEYLGVPRGTYTVEAGDQLVVYGSNERLERLAKRSRSLEGKQAHKEESERFEEELGEQDAAAKETADEETAKSTDR